MMTAHLLTTGRRILRARLDDARRNRQVLARIAVQTAAAVGATYAAVTWLDLPQMSWAVISALFTIGISADQSVANALGRIAGSLIGVALGLAFAATPGDGVVIGLILATVFANMIASVWPNLRYAAVTAAVISLDQSPEFASALERAATITLGTCIGAASGLLVWPTFGKGRTVAALRRALCDCEELLKLLSGAVGTDDRQDRDRLHAQFLSDLEAARSRLSSTRFRPVLPSGMRLRDAVNGVESLWHSVVILDRVISDKRNDLSDRTLDQLAPAIREVQDEAARLVAQVSQALDQKAPAPQGSDALKEAVARARDTTGRLLDTGDDRFPAHGKALNAVSFALDEIEYRLLAFADALLPDHDHSLQVFPTQQGGAQPQ